MQRILVSACLLGEAVRYDGGHHRLKESPWMRWQQEGRLVPLCPEVSGGLAVPRVAAEVTQGDSHAVLNKQGAVRTSAGMDVTAHFRKGAAAALALCRRYHIQMAILKEGSPSCGVELLHDGRFLGIKTAGSGVTSQCLRNHGIALFNERQLIDAANHLAQLETGK